MISSNVSPEFRITATRINLSACRQRFRDGAPGRELARPREPGVSRARGRQTDESQISRRGQRARHVPGKQGQRLRTVEENGVDRGMPDEEAGQVIRRLRPGSDGGVETADAVRRLEHIPKGHLRTAEQRRPGRIVHSGPRRKQTLHDEPEGVLRMSVVLAGFQGPPSRYSAEDQHPGIRRRYGIEAVDHCCTITPLSNSSSLS